MTRLSSLTASQIRMMVRLDDGKDHHDSTGLRLIDMTIEMASEANRLLKLGLVEAWGGRGEPGGYRLTEKGRSVREKGGQGQKRAVCTSLKKTLSEQCHRRMRK